MRENEAMAKINTGTDTCASRQSARDVLKGRADQLRRDAGRMHQEADRLESLANVMAGIGGPAEEALWALAINHSAPRLY